MKRLRKLAKIAAALGLILVGTIAAIIWRDSAVREALVSPIREAGDPVTIADLRPVDVATDDNAATYLVPVSEDLQKLVFKIYLIAFAEDFDWKSGLTDLQRQQTETLFAAHVQIGEAVQSASECQKLHWPLEYDDGREEFTESLHDHIDIARSVARFHIAKIRTLAAAGEADAAATVCLQGLRMVRLQDDTPTIVASLVNTACRDSLLNELGGLLKHHKLKSEIHQAIEQELAKHDLINALVQTLKSERAFGISCFRDLLSIPDMGWRTAEIANYVEYMNEQLIHSSNFPFEQTNVATVETSGMVNLLVPAVSGVREASFRSIAKLNCTRVFNAIQSRDPATQSPRMDQLGLPAETAVDPFSGDALIIKKTDAGWTIYSIGPNKTDDGGQVISDDASSLDVGI